MKILITGAFGNIGSSTIENFLEKNYSSLQVRCFDIKNEANEKKAMKFNGRIETIWGDLRKIEDVNSAVDGCDVIIHLAFLLPPVSETKQEFAYAVNVGGTKNVLSAIKQFSPGARIIFASSVSVYGPSTSNDPPRTISGPIFGTDNYTSHKVECEGLVKDSGLEWVITRFGVVPPLAVGGKFDAVLFEIPLDGKVEFVHTRDVGLACANAAFCKECAGKILLIGGGKRCQLYERDFISRFLEINGIGMLPEEAFTKKPYYTAWMDTEESQKLLSYQRLTFDDYLKEIKKTIGFRRYIIKLLSPVIRKSLLAKSPYYKK
jgi:nucleoside-diphosphate-sugar epimerase